MNPTDPNTLLPCPFCGDEMRITAFGSVRHSLEREHTCYIGATVFPLAKWNTRAPSELTRTTESVEIGSKSVVAAPQTPRTDAAAAKNLEQFPEGFTTFKPDAHVDASFARQLETELTQARAERDEARKERDEAVRHIQLAGGYHERTPREIEIAEVLSDSPPELWESADHALNDMLDIIDAGRNRVFTAEAERDAANALVDRLAGVLKAAGRLVSGKYTQWHYAGGVDDCAHGYSAGIPCPKCDAATLEAALAEVTKSLSPRTTENTKPQ